ncbi:MAG: CCA tRNA nucleotidyltransferase [Sedimentisphaerales bacterium]|nr:CCA tRNA nucleotidyltransferase [Sedimentisphaerales bacterium]
MTNKEAALKIVKRLRKSGFEALFAGGCVRDMLLSRRASDYDVATNAHPRDVIKLFRRTLKVGAKFGVVIVLMEKRQVEVATFRTETGYVDGRRPGTVHFSNAEEDACRRDFTINGMFFDPVKKEVIDYVDGRKDLKRKVLRTIGNPNERFSEDYLRMLRAVRFSTQLGFEIEKSTWLAICDNAKKITKISGERIAIEIESILTNPNRAKGMSLLTESGLAQAIFPNISSSQAKFGIRVLGYLHKKIDFTPALAGFFSECYTQFVLDECKILKLSRNNIKHIQFLLENRGKLLDEKLSLANLKKILAQPYFPDLYEMQKAIQKAAISGRKGLLPLTKLNRRIRQLGDVELQPKPLLNGHDLIRIGAVSGPSLGRLAEELYVAQLEGNLKTRDQALEWAKQQLNKQKPQ